jgi:hypothetical protein
MQIDKRRSAAGVAHAFHQLTKVGSCVGSQLIAGMAQVMQMNVESGRGERGIPDRAAKVGVPQRLAVVNPTA